jgi:hypothetical protein
VVHGTILFHAMKLLSPVIYNVISLNYDSVVEAPFEILNKLGVLRMAIGGKDKFFNRIESDTGGVLNFAKIHGSVENPTSIVPPTWNKYSSPDMLSAWRLAYRALSRSSEIRIIGYSMSPSDNYLKYLLLSAINENNALRKIKIVNPDENALENYQRIFRKELLKHIKMGAESYVGNLYSGLRDVENRYVDCNRIEDFDAVY